MRLIELGPEAYANDVLPLTASLWAGRRDFEAYVSQTLEIARSGYGKRHYRTLGFYADGKLVASSKRYDRSLHFGTTRLRGIGIGAVFTPEEFRGRGYASAMLAMILDRSRSEGYDFAYLFSDIRPQFYEDLGFRPLSSRAISMRADGLPHQRIEVTRLEENDWGAIHRCFELGERMRPWGFIRTPLVWEWIRLRIRHGSEHPIGTETNLVVRRGRGIAAYVLGVRTPEQDTYILDEFGFADAEAALLVGPMLRSAAGDLQRIVGWLPPEHARDILPRASVRKRRDAIFMVAPLTPGGERYVQAASLASSGDAAWSTDHI